MNGEAIKIYTRMLFSNIKVALASMAKTAINTK